MRLPCAVRRLPKLRKGEKLGISGNKYTALSFVFDTFTLYMYSLSIVV